MRIVDFIGQVFMLMIGLFCLTLGKDGIIFIAFLQFFMGVWQVISAIVTTANSKHGDPVRTTMIRVYWGVVAFYFVSLAGFAMVEEDLAIVWFFSAWLIAIYYFILTIRIAFLNKERKTFLDIANE